MAKGRMISAELISSDAFITLPFSVQALYMHLNVAADDDGFISSIIRTTRSVGSSAEDLQRLIDEGLLLKFDSGICLVTHWLIHNQIRKDRYTPTIHKKELALVKVVNRVYCLIDDDSEPEPENAQNESDPDTGNQMVSDTDTKRIPDGFEPDTAGNQPVTNTDTACNQSAPSSDTQISLDKYSLDKHRQGESKSNNSPAFHIPSVEESKDYAREIGYFDFNAEKFIAYYEARNWKYTDGTPITDWKKVVDLWRTREGDYKQKYSSPKQPAWQPTNQNDYDFEELAKKLIVN